MPIVRPSTVPITEPAPSPAPNCPGCGMPLQAEYVVMNADGERFYAHANASDCGLERKFDGWKGYGHFHSLRCATVWANRIWSRHLKENGKEIPEGIRGWGA